MDIEQAARKAAARQRQALEVAADPVLGKGPGRGDQKGGGAARIRGEPQPEGRPDNLPRLLILEQAPRPAHELASESLELPPVSRRAIPHPKPHRERI